MKKITLLLAAATMVLVCACGNTQGNKKKNEVKTDTEEQYIKADLKIKLDSLVQEMGRLSTPVFLDIQNGKLTLTDKEKKNKPSYLLPASKADEAVTLIEKYRIATMLGCDMTIASLYGMPVDSYKQAIANCSLTSTTPPSISGLTDSLKRLWTQESRNSTRNP